MLIPPTVGRVVWFRTNNRDSISLETTEPLAAIVTKVWNNRMVNIALFSEDGFAQSRTSVELVQPGDLTPSGQAYCEWMPYQKGQAAKTEQLEDELATTPVEPDSVDAMKPHD